ncbi:MAG: terminase gpA endonuclease subunit [Gemmataceae bacterium]
MAKGRTKASAKAKAAAKIDQRRAARAAARTVSAPPKPTPAARAKRKRCAESLREFCRVFLAAKFFLAFSDDHLRVIARLEHVVRHGGTFSLAMPRGSGKTELVKAAALWAILYGYRRYVVLIGATAGDATRIMADLKATLEGNADIAAAFPEATHCILDMRGTPQKARAQTWEDGKPTGLSWTKTSVRFAWVKGAPCNGAVIATLGLTGSIRGQSATGPNGETLRPDLVLLDDPQDRESATSPAQTAERERIVRGDVLGLAGPTKSIACVMPCTVIAESDLADRLLDRELNPQWQGERTKLVYSFPTDEEKWETYFDMRGNELRNGGDGSSATAFYVANRADMDAGCVMAWPERFDRDRFASAIEEAMVRRHDDPEAFAAEFQNDPLRLDESQGSMRTLDAATVAAKLGGRERGIVPAGTTQLVSFVDVGTYAMWFGVAAFDERFNGWLVDAGPFPSQNRSYFAARDARPSLADLFPGHTEPQLIHAGLRSLVSDLFARRYVREVSGEVVHLDRCLIDARWQTDTVHGFIRSSPHAASLLGSKGYSTISNVRAMNDWQTKPGERVGWNWRLGPAPGGRGRQLLFDPDAWKTFFADRIATPPGGSGSFQLFGNRPDEHRLLADHVAAEYSVRVTVRDRRFDKWEARPNRDNHLFDVLVGLHVAASVGGINWTASAAAGDASPAPTMRKRVKLSELMERKERERLARDGSREAYVLR